MMTWSTGQKINDRRGFTLVELILVMVLMLGLLAMAGPRLNRFSRGRVLTSQAQMLVEQINAARDRAASRAVVCRVVIDVEDGTTRILEQRGGTFVDLDGTIGRAIYLPQGFQISLQRLDGIDASESWIELRPTGWSSPAVITLSDQSGDTLHVVGRTPLEPYVVTDLAKEVG